MRQTKAKLEQSQASAIDIAVASALSIAAVAVTFNAWRDTLRIGLKDEECSYVLVAPAVIFWLGWIRQRRLFHQQVRGNWVGLLLLVAGWGAYQYGYYSDPVLWRAGAVLLSAGAFVTGIGFDAAWVLLPALAACVFLIPIDPNGRYQIAAPLQTATADITQKVCEMIGMNVHRSRNLLSFNGVDVTIAEACNGMRMVTTLFLVCYVVAFQWSLNAWLRLVVLAASPLFAIVSNVIRLVPTVWVFGYYSPETAERFHEISGWVMTSLAFVGLMSFIWLVQTIAGPRPEACDSQVQT